MTRTDWMDWALCRSTDFDPWVDEHKPRQAVLDRLRAVCADCPVSSQCASYALDTGAAGGVYAGVYVPHRTHRLGEAWIRARKLLADEVASVVAS